MQDDFNNSFMILAKGPPATAAEVKALNDHFGNVPQEYLDLVAKATEIEIQHALGKYLRVWGPAGCIEMDEGYGIRNRIPGAFPIGDDGGGEVIFYTNGNRGRGLYHVGYGNLDLQDAIWVAASLTDLLKNSDGIESF